MLVVSMNTDMTIRRGFWVTLAVVFTGFALLIIFAISVVPGWGAVALVVLPALFIYVVKRQGVETVELNQGYSDLRIHGYDDPAYWSDPIRSSAGEINERCNR